MSFVASYEINYRVVHKELPLTSIYFQTNFQNYCFSTQISGKAEKCLIVPTTS